MNFGRTLKKVLKRNDLPADFVTWSAIARDRPRWRLLAHPLYTHAQSPDAKPPGA
jgi:esterase/lipase superfamily enzyme